MGYFAELSYKIGNCINNKKKKKKKKIFRLFDSTLTFLVLKVIYKGRFKSFVALYADRIGSDQQIPIRLEVSDFLFINTFFS